ncbi:MAG: dTMP kinase [Actinobacteria bacterium]|nr:dTMP kinase [Actinomycetota bacterium]
MARDDLLGGSDDLFGSIRGGGRSVYVSLLAEPNYRRFFLATFTSSLGDWIGLFAILALTESIVGQGQASRATAFAFSGVMIARILPIMLLGPVAGVYADRWDRKRTLVATDIARGAIMAIIPFSQDFLQLFVASFLVEVVSMLFAPAKEATLPNLVPRRRLVQANQLTLTVTYGTLPLGGVLLAVFVAAASLFPDWTFLQERPASLAIWINALTFFGSAALFARMAVPGNGRARRGRAEPEGPSAWEELKEGLRFIATHPRIRALITGVMAAAFAGGALVPIAKLYVSVIGASDSAFGLLIAAVGLGMLTGLLAAVPAAEHFGRMRVFAPGIAIGGLFTIVTALMPSVWPATFAAFGVGLGAGVAFVTGYTQLQVDAGDDLRGRAFAAFNTGVRLSIFAALVLAPALVGVLGTEPRDTYVVGGVRITMILAGVVALAGAAWSWWQHERPNGGTPDLDLGGDDVSTTERGVFVAFEGGEGAGKSTQMRLLRAEIERAGYEVLLTREPGGTDLGERLRELVLDPDAEVDDRAEALLYAAARAQHATEVIRPALDRGVVVLSDRYVVSSIVYQGAARGLGEDQINELNRWGTDGLVPDLVILLDIDADEGLRRSGEGSGDGPDRLEAEGVQFHRVVNDAFRRLAETHPGRYLVLDATRPVEDLRDEIASHVLAILERTDRVNGGVR